MVGVVQPRPPPQSHGVGQAAAPDTALRMVWPATRPPLVHFSRKPLQKVHASKQISSRIGHKPLGLWVSVEGEDDWPSWSRHNWPSWFSEIRHATEVIVRPEARLLVIDNETELCDLNKRFPSTRRDDYFQSPDWKAIAAEYQGIIIWPYQWEVRLSLMWYYTWDCASGCLWDPDAVDRLVPRPEKVPVFDEVTT